MNISRWLALTTLAGAVVTGSACVENSADRRTSEAGAALDAAQRESDAALTSSRQGADKALDATKDGAAAVVDETRAASEKAADATRNVAEKTVDKTKEIAAATARKTGAAVSATGEAITDGWITTKVTAKFVDETLLRGSDINVDTDDHVVTLKGTVRSDAAKTRAAAVARGTEGVVRVVNQLVVKLN